MSFCLKNTTSGEREQKDRMCRMTEVYFYTTLPLIARQLGGVPRSGEGVKICFILAFCQKLIIQTKKILSETILSHPIPEISHAQSPATQKHYLRQCLLSLISFCQNYRTRHVMSLHAGKKTPKIKWRCIINECTSIILLY